MLNLSQSPVLFRVLMSSSTLARIVLITLLIIQARLKPGAIPQLQAFYLAKLAGSRRNAYSNAGVAFAVICSNRN